MISPDGRRAPAAHVVGLSGQVHRGHVRAHGVAHVGVVASEVGVPGAHHAAAGRLGLGHLPRDRAHHVVVRLPRPGLVERAHPDHTQPVGVRVLAGEQIACRLGDRIRVLRPERRRLLDRQALGRAVDLARAHHHGHGVGRLVAQRLQQVHRHREVVAHDRGGLLPGASHRRVRREVEDALRARVGQRAPDRLAVEQVELGARRRDALGRRGPPRGAAPTNPPPPVTKAAPVPTT